MKRQPAPKVRQRGSAAALGEVAYLAVVGMLLLGAAIYVPVTWDLDRLSRATTRAAEDVGDHIGWLLAIDIQLLLAFYLAVIGGQLFGDIKKQESTKRLLGVIGEAVAGLSLPFAVLLVLAAAIDRTFVVPAACAMIGVLAVAFLAVQLGTFVVPDPEVQLQVAREELARVTRRMSRLPTDSWPGSVRAVVLVGLNLLVAVVLSALPTMSYWWWRPAGTWIVLVAGAILAVGAGIVATIAAYFVFRGPLPLAVYSITVAVLLIGGMVWISASALGDRNTAPFAWGWIVATAISTGSSASVTLFRGRPLTLGALARSRAHVSLRGRSAALAQTIASLESQKPRATVGTRLTAALRAWRAE